MAASVLPKQELLPQGMSTHRRNTFRAGTYGVYGQTAVVASVALAKEVGNLDRVSAIEIATTRRGHQQAGSEPEKWTPQTRGTADHSLPYSVARAMFDGDITNDSYVLEKLKEVVPLGVV
jgi:2-methylcitrate dehydratase PrpD